jgi:hypothetical protein
MQNDPTQKMKPASGSVYRREGKRGVVWYARLRLPKLRGVGLLRPSRAGLARTLARRSLNRACLGEPAPVF